MTRLGLNNVVKINQQKNIASVIGFMVCMNDHFPNTIFLIFTRKKI